MKFWSYIVILTAMIVFLEVLGIPTGLSTILSYIGITISPTSATIVSGTFESSSLWAKLFLAGSGILLVASAAGSLIIGLFAKSYDTSLVILPFIIAITSVYIGAFTPLIYYLNQTNAPSWIIMVAGVILIPLGVGFILSAVDYFAGR